jgi:hypothetical protein
MHEAPLGALVLFPSSNARLCTSPAAPVNSKSAYQDSGPDHQDRSPQQSSHMSLLRLFVGNALSFSQGDNRRTVRT